MTLSILDFFLHKWKDNGEKIHKFKVSFNLFVDIN